MSRILHRFILVAAFLPAFHQQYVQGQGIRPTITASVGAIRNLQTDPEFARFAFYREIQVSTPLIRLKYSPLSLIGSLHGGGWFDNVDTVSRSRDSNTTYSHTSLIVGSRLYLSTTPKPSPVSFFAGISHHFVWADYVGGTSMGRPGEDYRDSINTAEFGLRLQYPVGQHVIIGGGSQLYVALPYSEDDSHAYRIGYVIMASYTGD